MTTDDEYLRKLVHAAATLVAKEAGAHVTSDDFEYAYIFMKNHILVLAAQYRDLLE